MICSVPRLYSSHPAPKHQSARSKICERWSTPLIGASGSIIPKTALPDSDNDARTLSRHTSQRNGESESGYCGRSNTRRALEAGSLRQARNRRLKEPYVTKSVTRLEFFPNTRFELYQNDTRRGIIVEMTIETRSSPGGLAKKTFCVHANPARPANRQGLPLTATYYHQTLCDAIDSIRLVAKSFGTALAIRISQ